ncbi:MAG: hypothetical protein N3D15_09810 [Syntrophorhabdaceae bacterium]|nr:hypothetical protein [Syntrophorhabdaceae bacterium]
MYRAFLVDKDIIKKDIHFSEGCTSCHKGNPKAWDRKIAHKGLISRPSKDLLTCESCHGDVVKKFRNSMHFTTAGLREGVKGRFSEQELKVFDSKVFEASCRSCHASCGDCHVSAPVIGGVKSGLIKGHRFVKRDEGKTCALCHGGRVYPEFTGEYGGTADIHYQKGMVCVDCHKKGELHGDGVAYKSMKEIKDRPKCINCHKIGEKDSEKAMEAHMIHKDRLSCYACHSSSPYRNCYNCHLGKGAESKPNFFLGINPRDKKTFTTLRLVPTVRNTFKSAGINMENFDKLPNYWDTAPHNIRKRTDRTRSCDVCHKERRDYLTSDKLIKDGSKANLNLIIKEKK